MASMTIELNSDGIKEFLKSDDVRDMLENRAEQVRQRCGDGYETDTYQASTRVIASVYTYTTEAMLENLENNTILKATR